VEAIQAAFEQIDALGPALQEAGDSIASIVHYIQTMGSLEGFDWTAWNQQYGAVWEKIGQANAEQQAKMQDAAQAQIDAASRLSSAASDLSNSAAAIDSAASKLREPPPVTVYTTVGEESVVNGG